MKYAFSRSTFSIYIFNLRMAQGIALLESAILQYGEFPRHRGHGYFSCFPLFVRSVLLDSSHKFEAPEGFTGGGSGHDAA